MSAGSSDTIRAYVRECDGSARSHAAHERVNSVRTENDRVFEPHERSTDLQASRSVQCDPTGYTNHAKCPTLSRLSGSDSGEPSRLVMKLREDVYVSNYSAARHVLMSSHFMMLTKSHW